MNAAKLTVRRAFSRAATHYDDAARFQRETASALLAGLGDCGAPDTIADIGCGTGHGTGLLRQRWPAASVLMIDSALGMARRLPAGTPRVCADAEALPLATNSVDLYWSSLTMQWCDTQAFAREAARVMKPGAWLAISTLGAETFAQFRIAFSGVDAYRHTIDFRSEDEVSAEFRRQGLSVEATRGKSTILHYPDLVSLVGDVRTIGANRVTGANRRRGLMGKSAWQRFTAAYEAQRAAPGLPLSYQSILLYARK